MIDSASKIIDILNHCTDDDKRKLWYAVHATQVLNAIVIPSYIINTLIGIVRAEPNNFDKDYVAFIRRNISLKEITPLSDRVGDFLAKLELVEPHFDCIFSEVCFKYCAELPPEVYVDLFL